MERQNYEDTFEQDSSNHISEATETIENITDTHQQCENERTDTDSWEDPQDNIDTNPKRSQRINKTPTYLKDYYCHTVTEHWCGLVKYKESNDSKIQHTSHIEPKNYKTAMLKPHWKNSMDLEISALERNKTWEVVPLPLGKKAIGSKC